MFKSHEQHDNPYPAPHAYDGSWLEMLENPHASPPTRDGGAGKEAGTFDTSPTGSSPGFDLSD